MKKTRITALINGNEYAVYSLDDRLYFDYNGELISVYSKFARENDIRLLQSINKMRRA